MSSPAADHQITLRHPMVFLGLFTLVFCVLYAAYFFLPDSVLREVIYHYGICQVGADTINLLVPAESVNAVGNTIASPRAVLEIVRGCDGAGAMFLLVAAIVAFPASWWHKLVGLVGGLLLAYAINQLRIVALYFVVAYQPGWFTPLHTFYLPTLVVLLYCVLFGVWAYAASGKR